MDTASKFVLQACGWGTTTYTAGIFFVCGLICRFNQRLVKSWNTVDVALRSILSITVSPFQCQSHWSPSCRAVRAEGGRTDTGCPSCHPHWAAEGRSRCRKDTSQHQAPGSAAGRGHGQTHELPLVRDPCLNRTAKDKGIMTLKLVVESVECFNKTTRTP